MEDIFFIIDLNWKNNIKYEYKRYPSLLYFLFKYPECEKELRNFLSKTDSIKKNNTEKFPTFLLILRIFSNIDNLDSQFKDKDFFGSLIKKEILLNLKNRNCEIYQKAPDVNWIGLLINNMETFKYLSPKIINIFNYLDNICQYPIKIEEKNKKIYEIVIKKMLDCILKIIFDGKLDDLFTEIIPKIDEDDIEVKDINNISYFTNLSDIFKIILKKEIKELEQNLYNKFNEEIIKIKEIFKKNENIYVDFIEVIKKDTENEIKERIEYNYKKENNKLEDECKEIEEKKK